MTQRLAPIGSTAIALLLALTGCAGGEDTPEPPAGETPPAAAVEEEGVPAQDPAGETFRGEFTYMADAHLFIECATGKRYPVRGPAVPELEREYLLARFWPGDWVLAELVGSIEEHRAWEGEGTEPWLVVTGVNSLVSNGSCTDGSGEPAAGVYTVFLTGLSNKGRVQSLHLDPGGTFTWVHDYQLRERPPEVQRGTWKQDADTTVTLDITTEGRLEAGTRTFKITRTRDLLLTSRAYGMKGLKLQRLEPDAGCEPCDAMLLDLYAIIIDSGRSVRPGGLLPTEHFDDHIKTEEAWARLNRVLLGKYHIPRQIVEKLPTAHTTIGDVTLILKEMP